MHVCLLPRNKNQKVDFGGEFGGKIEIGVHESPKSFGEVDTVAVEKYQCIATGGKGSWEESEASG